MSKVKREKLSEQAADRLLEMIVDEHRYESGSKLPNENELAEQLEVSRTTLREAISFLVAHGVLKIQRGKGTFVSTDLPQGGMDLRELSDIHSRVRATDLFEMRLIFEPATVSLACERASDEELEQIRKYAERMERTALTGGDWAAVDQEFHLAIIRSSHNEYMRRLYPIINGAVSEIMQISKNRQHMQEIAVADNRMILEFLLKRDASGARAAMVLHLKHLINTLNK